MGIVSRFGKWLDTRFPEKISTEEVVKSMAAWSNVKTDVDLIGVFANVLDERLKRIETGLPDTLHQVSLLKDDMNKCKAILQMKQTATINMPDFSGKTAWKR